jgi:hypothetical protein
MTADRWLAHDYHQCSKALQPGCVVRVVKAIDDVNFAAAVTAVQAAAVRVVEAFMS